MNVNLFGANDGARAVDSLSAAPLGRRFGAVLLDTLAIAGYVLVLLGIGMGVHWLGGSGWHARLAPATMDGLALVVLVLPVIAYFTLSEGSAAAATWGKRCMRLRVMATTGVAVGYRRAAVRALVKFAPWQLAHTCLLHIPGWPWAPLTPPPWVMTGLILAEGLPLVFLLCLLFSRGHRAPYDWIAGTMVIDAAAD